MSRVGHLLLIRHGESEGNRNAGIMVVEHRAGSYQRATAIEED